MAKHVLHTAQVKTNDLGGDMISIRHRLRDVQTIYTWLVWVTILQTVRQTLKLAIVEMITQG